MFQPDNMINRKTSVKIHEQGGVFLKTKHRTGREYNTQRVSGLWLVYIGIVIFLAAMTGGTLLMQPFVIGIGYAAGYILIFGLPYVHRKLAYGENTKFQNMMDNISIIFLVVFCTLCGFVIGFSDLRLLWLSVFLVVGLHFFGFYFSQGRLMLWLGLLTVLNAIAGILLIDIPFLVFAAIDAFLKFTIGMRMLLLKKQPIIMTSASEKQSK